ncbi:TPR repeat protein, SEL1 subfamily [Legionella beliardensis]|uniref:TPR repeat protein, SEL1 subfamily n=1 Tax=Legionella beliardensis TaxID=91822 RepID=A0A378JSX8_9GAMM|nr:tetratricopeptide repeat protein [Legionella beliardensis]STX55773.1 TPR repeat protein, SEL1 subfamily [Legionella beliardensis]
MKTASDTVSAFEMNNHAKLFAMVIKQLLEGNYTSSFRLSKINYPFKQLVAHNKALSTLINNIIQQCQTLANNEHTLALLGFLAQHDLSCLISPLSAADSYEQAIKINPNHAFAINNRAQMYRSGQGSPVNFSKAIELFDKAIELGSIAALSNRASMYQLGHGGPVDFQKAIEFFDKAIALGDTYAMMNRAQMYQRGQGGEVDLSKAIELYEKAIVLGDTSAIFPLACLYRSEGTNVTRAIELLDMAINLGDTNALLVRAYMYESGQGSAVDFSKAIELYEKARTLGNTSAAFMLACIYQLGQHGEPNLAQAIYLYEQAIRGNSNDALRNLNDISINEEVAKKLVDLVWDELIEGRPFSEKTLAALSKYCKPIIIEKITGSELKTSVAFLKQLTFNFRHPLTLILNDNDVSKQSNELNKIIQQARLLNPVRQLFFKQSQQSTCALAKLPLEITDYILSFTQPGLLYDRKREHNNNFSDVQSQFSEQHLQRIVDLINQLKKEVNSHWPYPNKKAKKEKINALVDLISLSKSMTINEAIEKIEQRYPVMREGKTSTRTSDLLDALKSSVIVPSQP